MNKVYLCKGCIEMLKEHYPYIDNELEITEVTSITACDNHENNMGKENRKVNSKKVKRVFNYKKGQALEKETKCKSITMN